MEAEFQSLNRAYKRSDIFPFLPCLKIGRSFNPSIGLTSVPTVPPKRKAVKLCSFNPSIGLTSVPTEYISLGSADELVVSTPQSGLQAFRPHESMESPIYYKVSIPQSGLQAFRHRI